MKKSVILLLLLFSVLLWQGCSPDVPPKRIEKAGDITFGTVIRPVRGEGVAFYHGKSLLREFSRVRVEVTPFEHRVWRVVFEGLDLPGTADELDIAAGVIEQHYPVKFTADGADARRAALPETTIRLSRAFHLGPRCVAVEFTDLAGAERAAELKKDPRFKQISAIQEIRKKLAVIAHAIDSFQLDNSAVPATLDDLLKKPLNTPKWDGPYLTGKTGELLKGCTYRKLSGSKYELYTIFNGKRITEDY